MANAHGYDSRANGVDGTFHPCFNEKAHRTYARMHLPVAPRCNVQCRFCNRKYDCFNETRPGVTSKILTPERAAALVGNVKRELHCLAVVGIAGPGDPLANEETFETLNLVREEHPDMTLCLATNGLNLPTHAQRLSDLGVEYVTVTVNAIDQETIEKIYSWVRHEGTVLRGRPGAELLSKQQWRGIGKCIENGLIVKVNSVFVPGINDSELKVIAERSRELGVEVMNVIPFLPVDGSEFECRRAPTAMEIRNIREECAGALKQITHCARCRADAIGFLGCDRSNEFYESLEIDVKSGRQ